MATAPVVAIPSGVPVAGTATITVTGQTYTFTFVPNPVQTPPASYVPIYPIYGF